MTRKSKNIQQLRLSKSRFIIFWRFSQELIINHKLQIAVFIIAFGVFFLRRTDALLNPQLFAEDGREWLQDDLDNQYSPRTVLFTYAGYLTVFPRLVGIISGLFPIEYTPLMFNVFALSVQSILLVYLWTKRIDFIKTKLKIFITVFYLLMPFTNEIHGNLTNSQWSLALVLFLLLFIREAKNKTLRYFEWGLAFVISLNGPFSILLAPIILFDSWRSKKLITMHKVVLAGVLIQFVTVLLSLDDRKREHIGPSVTHFIDIIGSQLFGAGLFGAETANAFLEKPWMTPLMAVLGLQILLYVFIKADRMLRYFICFAGLVFMSSIVSPNGVPAGSSWLQVLKVEDVGGRYYFIPHVAMFVSLGWLLLTEKKVHMFMRLTSGVLLGLALFIGVPNDFIHKPYADYHYDSYMKKYRSLAPGEEITIPTNPGSPWEVRLTR